MIYVCTLTRDSISASTTFDLIQMIRRSPNYLFAGIVGTYIQNLREGAAEAVLQSGASHILFIDSDMKFPEDTIERLLSHNKDIVAANYVQRVLQHKWTAMINGESLSSVGKTGLQEVDAIGMGVCLIKTNVFKQMKRPRFNMAWNDAGGYYWGEDVSFCNSARELGFKIWIDHDLSQFVQHIGSIELGVNHHAIVEYDIPNIDGWMFPMEMEFLYNTSKMMNSVVEVGSWKGRSTHAIASGCKDGVVYSIDHWQGSEKDITIELAKKEDIYSIFLTNTKQFKNIRAIRGFSHNVVKQFKEPVDMVFLDATHLYEDIKQDIEDWLPLTNKLICGHDYSNEFPDVIRAVNEKFGKPDGIVGTIWFVNIKKEN